MNDLVSIIIPCYNVEEYISDCIKSLINQTYKNIEIIFIDDCSKDNTKTIIKKYKKDDKRIKLISNKENLGAGLTRNKGLKSAKGKYIMFMDPDDLLASNTVIKKLLSFFAKKEVDAVRGNFKIIEREFSLDNKENKIQDSWTYNIKKAKVIGKDDFTSCPSYGYTTYLLKKEIIKENNISFPDYKYYEDPYFLAFYLSKCRKIYEVPVDVYLYRVINMPNKEWTIIKYRDTCSSIIKILNIYKKNNMKSSYTMQVEEFLNISKEIIFSPLIKNRNVIKDMDNVLKTIEQSFMERNYRLIGNAKTFILKEKIKNIIFRIKRKVRG